MRLLSALALVAACWAASGCAATITRIAALQEAVSDGDDSEIDELPALDASDLSGMAFDGDQSADVEAGDVPPEPDMFVVYTDNRDSIVEEQQVDAEPAVEVEAAVETETAEAVQALTPIVEEVVKPEASEREPFKALQGEAADLDRFGRPVADIPLDIRPTAGVMPEDVAKEVFAAANSPELRESDQRPPILCAWSPWTIGYRPLYFEEIPLERYGMTYGLLQPAVSGAHFFGSVAALPYKMVVHPPRSCLCSNGFSRMGDIPLPGYGQRELRLDAGLVEAGVIVGIIYILP
jgi:hypothetical protein